MLAVNIDVGVKLIVNVVLNVQLGSYGGADSQLSDYYSDLVNALGQEYFTVCHSIAGTQSLPFGGAVTSSVHVVIKAGGGLVDDVAVSVFLGSKAVRLEVDADGISVYKLIDLDTGKVVLVTVKCMSCTRGSALKQMLY